MRATVAVLGAVTALAGCNSTLIINCTNDQMCVRNGAQGTCTTSTVTTQKFCAFSDGACAGGKKWDPTAGDGLAGSCVGGMQSGDGSTGGKDMATMGGPDMTPNIVWEKRTSGVTDWLFGIWGTGPNNIYAGGQISKAILHSTDGGMTWTKEFLPIDSEINAIWGTSAGDVWAGSDSGLMFHWDGTGWSMLQTPSTDNINAMWGVGSELWSAGDSGTIMHYKVGGMWTLQMPIPMACQNTLHGIFGSDNLHLSVVGYNGVYCATVDGGANWLPINNTGDTKSLGGIWGSTDKYLFIAAEIGTVYRSTSNGSAWKLDITPTTDDLFGVLGNSSSDVYMVGGDPTSVIIHWNGTAWTEQKDPVNQGLNGIWASGPTDYYIVGYNGTILHGPP